LFRLFGRAFCRRWVQADAPLALVEMMHKDAECLTGLDHLARVLHPDNPEVGDVQQTFHPVGDFHECAEVLHAHNFYS
jgi:hypothetical protein